MRYLLSRVAILFLAMTAAHAETYMNIGPLDTLGSVKARFPKAQFQKTNPAWAQNSDVMYTITGMGITGTIVVKFVDNRAMWKEAYEKETDPKTKEIFKTLTDQTDNEAISVSWVRWVPDTPIPLQRLISKYGNPEKTGFTDEDFQPYRTWTTRGLSVYLTDNEKQVQRIDFSFTNSDYRKAYIQKYNTVPDWLK